MMVRTDEKRSKMAAAAASLLYAAMWVLLMLFVTCDRDIPAEAEGILINFGDSETGRGEQDLAASDNVASTPASSPSASQPTPEEFITQQTPDAPVVPQTTQRPTPAQTQQDRQSAPNPVEAPPTEAPREPDQRALFPGRSDSQATSEGTSGGEGNQGNLAGTPEGSHQGTGTGTSGDSYSLSGRSLIGSLPKPDYSVREEGRVIIEIRVDQQGKVTSTSYRSVGSTTSNSTLVAAARRAAGQARFNVDETAPFPQVGTITYNFRMN